MYQTVMLSQLEKVLDVFENIFIKKKINKKIENFHDGNILNFFAIFIMNILIKRKCVNFQISMKKFIYKFISVIFFLNSNFQRE